MLFKIPSDIAVKLISKTFRMLLLLIATAVVSPQHVERGGKNCMDLEGLTFRKILSLDATTLLMNSASYRLTNPDSRLLVSRDGGACWHVVGDMEPHVADYFVIRTGEIFVTKTIEANIRLAVSKDKGESWEKVFWDFDSIPEIVTRKPGGDLVAFTSKNEFVILAPDKRHWFKYSTIENDPRDLYFVSDRIGWVSTKTGLLMTTDGGGTWEDKTHLIARSLSRWKPDWIEFRYFNLSESGRGIIGVDFGRSEIRNELGEVISKYVGGGMIFSTADFGKSWNPHLITESRGLASVFWLKDSNHLWVTTMDNWRINGYLYSDNLGKNWKELRIPQEMQTVSSLTFVSPKVGWMKTDDGFDTSILYTTQNGGITWKRLGPKEPED